MAYVGIFLSENGVGQHFCIFFTIGQWWVTAYCIMKREHLPSGHERFFSITQEANGLCNHIGLNAIMMQCLTAGGGIFGKQSQENFINK